MSTFRNYFRWTTVQENLFNWKKKYLKKSPWRHNELKISNAALGRTLFEFLHEFLQSLLSHYFVNLLGIVIRKLQGIQNVVSLNCFQKPFQELLTKLKSSNFCKDLKTRFPVTLYWFLKKQFQELLQRWSIFPQELFH